MAFCAPTDLIQHLVALIEHEDLRVTEPKVFVADERVKATRSRDDNVRVSILVLQDLDVFLHWRSAVEHRSLDLRHVFAESRVFVLDLVRQLTSVAHD